MSQTPCRFGYNCTRPNCYFAHPQGRAIDSAPSSSHKESRPHFVPQPPAAFVPTTGAPAFVPSGSAPVTPAHMPPHGYPPFIPHAPPVGACPPYPPYPDYAGYPPGGAYEGYPHGEGKAGEFGGSEDGYDGYDEYDDEEEDLCPCCGGYPSRCVTPGCARRGYCGCLVGLTPEEREEAFDRENMRLLEDQMASRAQGGSEEESKAGGLSLLSFDAEDFYPMSMKCECCKGFPYRCETKLAGCVKNTPGNRVCNGSARTVCACRT